MEPGIPLVPRTGVHDGGTRGQPVLLHHRGQRVLRRAGDGARHRLSPSSTGGGTPDEVGEPIHGSLALELIWTGIPFILAMVMFVWGASVYFALARVPDEAMDIYAVGKQWMWKFQHREGQREINELHVPVEHAGARDHHVRRRAAQTSTSRAFRTKMDAIPGRYTQLWFTATKPGTYHIFCAEYCGTRHSGMIGRVVVMPQHDFQAWLGGGATEGTLAQARREAVHAVWPASRATAPARRAARAGAERRCSARTVSSPAATRSPRTRPTSASRSSTRRPRSSRASRRSCRRSRAR